MREFRESLAALPLLVGSAALAGDKAGLGEQLGVCPENAHETVRSSTLQDGAALPSPHRAATDAELRLELGLREVEVVAELVDVCRCQAAQIRACKPYTRELNGIKLASLEDAFAARVAVLVRESIHPVGTPSETHLDGGVTPVSGVRTAH